MRRVRPGRGVHQLIHRLSAHSKQSWRIDEQHLHVLRLPVPCYFAEAAASTPINWKLSVRMLCVLPYRRRGGDM
jgi:hypothetical protein